MKTEKFSWSLSKETLFRECQYKYFYTYIAPRESYSLLEKLRRLIFLNDYLFFKFKELFQALITSQDWRHKEGEFRDALNDEIEILCYRVEWEFVHSDKSEIPFYEHFYYSEKWGDYQSYAHSIVTMFRDNIDHFMESEMASRLVSVPQLSWRAVSPIMQFDFMDFSIAISPLLIWEESGRFHCFDLSLYERSVEKAMMHCHLFAFYATLHLYVEPDLIQYNTLSLDKCETLTLSPSIDEMVSLKAKLQQSQEEQHYFTWLGPHRRSEKITTQNKGKCISCKFKMLCYP